MLSPLFLGEAELCSLWKGGRVDIYSAILSHRKTAVSLRDRTGAQWSKSAAGKKN
jgi:hypothetical protein